MIADAHRDKAVERRIEELEWRLYPEGILSCKRLKEGYVHYGQFSMPVRGNVDEGSVPFITAYAYGHIWGDSFHLTCHEYVETEDLDLRLKGVFHKQFRTREGLERFLEERVGPNPVNTNGDSVAFTWSDLYEHLHEFANRVDEQPLVALRAAVVSPIVHEPGHVYAP
ncbi:MAG: hypothetical protein ACMXYM_05485 [Candidatus Woesearchaeota archaeon]